MPRYVLSARLLHWLMALGFGFMWLCGYAMGSLVAEDGPWEEILMGLHISGGVTLLGLLVLRIGIRLTNRPPALPQGLSPLEKLGSHLGHLALYLLPLAVIVLGWAEADFGGHGVHWFSFAMPKVFPTMEMWGTINVEDLADTLHTYLAYLMLAVAVVHVAAVVKHRWFDGHDVLGRMGFGRPKE
ncbi:MAG: cytochrome b/b6 domain-containing protein [Pelagimonas sp.]